MFTASCLLTVCYGELGVGVLNNKCKNKCEFGQTEADCIMNVSKLAHE